MDRAPEILTDFQVMADNATKKIVQWNPKCARKSHAPFIVSYRIKLRKRKYEAPKSPGIKNFTPKAR